MDWNRNMVDAARMAWVGMLSYYLFEYFTVGRASMGDRLSCYHPIDLEVRAEWMTHARRRSVWGRANQAETAEPHLLASVCNYEDFFRLSAFSPIKLPERVAYVTYASERTGRLR